MSDDDHEVGYCKPPREHQFKPGQSGNKKGRPKASNNKATIIRDVLLAKVRVHVDGKTKTVTRFEAIFMKLVQKAHGGDLRAIKHIYELADKYDLLEPLRATFTGGVLIAPAQLTPEEWMKKHGAAADVQQGDEDPLH